MFASSSSASSGTISGLMTLSLLISSVLSTPHVVARAGPAYDYAPAPKLSSSTSKPPAPLTMAPSLSTSPIVAPSPSSTIYPSGTSIVIPGIPSYITSTQYSTSTRLEGAVSTLPAVILPPSPQSAAAVLANYSAQVSAASSSKSLYATPRASTSLDFALTPIIFPTAAAGSPAPSEIAFEHAAPPLITSTSLDVSSMTTSAVEMVATETSPVSVPATSSFVTVPSETPTAQATSSPQPTSAATRVAGTGWLVAVGLMTLLVL